MASSTGASQGDRIRVYAAPEITVSWDSERCLHFAECVRGAPAVFEPGRRPWVDPARAAAEHVAEVVTRCPTGALHYVSGSVPDEVPSEPPEVELTEWGPALLRGRLAPTITDSGRTVNETRMAECRCGGSRNLPFCDAVCRSAEHSTTA